MFCKRLILLFLVLPVYLVAAVGIELDSNIRIETSGGVRVEIDGDLSGDGYFRGELCSGSRTGMTEFAGLSLSLSMDGSITRITGSSYSEGNGEGTNIERYFILNNSSGSSVTADVTFNFIASGGDDERNGLNGPFFIYRYASGWQGYGDGDASSPISAGSVVIPADSSVWMLSEGIGVKARLFLEGPYDASGDSMLTILCPDYDNVIPLTSPYAADDRSCTAVPSCVTDWVLVEVRSSMDGSSIGSRACFLKSDGYLVADDGSTDCVGVCCCPGDYYLVIKHRNHLDIETSSACTGLTWGTEPDVYNFTSGTGKYKGGDACMLETSVYGMYTGDADDDGQVQVDDKNDYWQTQVGESGYKCSDFDLNGQVQISDKNDYWIDNTGKGSQVVY